MAKFPPEQIKFKGDIYVLAAKFKTVLQDDVVYYGKPSFFEDTVEGHRLSFWTMRVGVSTRFKSMKKLLSALGRADADDFVVWNSSDFSTPYKKYVGMRLNRIASRRDSDKSAEIGAEMSSRLLELLKRAGLSAQLHPSLS